MVVKKWIRRLVGVVMLPGFPGVAFTEYLVSRRSLKGRPQNSLAVMERDILGLGT